MVDVIANIVLGSKNYFQKKEKVRSDDFLKRKRERENNEKRKNTRVKV